MLGDCLDRTENKYVYGEGYSYIYYIQGSQIGGKFCDSLFEVIILYCGYIKREATSTDNVRASLSALLLGELLILGKKGKFNI